MALKRVGRTLKETLLVNDNEQFYLDNISEFRGWLEDSQTSSDLLNNNVALSVFANSSTGVTDLFDYSNTSSPLVTNNDGQAIIETPKLGSGLAKSNNGMNTLANDRQAFKNLLQNQTVAGYIENNKSVFDQEVITVDSLTINPSGDIDADIDSSKDVVNKSGFSIPIQAEVNGAGGGGGGGRAFDNDIDSSSGCYGDTGSSGESTTFMGVTAGGGGGGAHPYTGGSGTDAGNGLGSHGGSGGSGSGSEGSSGARGGHGEQVSTNATLSPGQSEFANLGQGGAGGSGCNGGSHGTSGSGNRGERGSVHIHIDIDQI